MCGAVRGRAWTEERIRRELDRLLPGLEEWPPYALFRHRAKSLHAELCRRGGTARWAKEYGLPMRAQYSTRWSQAAIRDTLRQTLRGSNIAVFPTMDWLRTYGPPGLANAVQRTGGRRRWATEFGVPLIHQPVPAQQRKTSHRRSKE